MGRKKEPKLPEFPEQLYVTSMVEDGETWFTASEKIFDAAHSDGEEREVAVYELVGLRKVKLVAEVTE